MASTSDVNYESLVTLDYMPINFKIRALHLCRKLKVECFAT